MNRGKIINSISVFGRFIHFIHTWILIYWLNCANSVSVFHFHSSFILQLPGFVSVVVFASSVLMSSFKYQTNHVSLSAVTITVHNTFRVYNKWQRSSLPVGGLVSTAAYDRKAQSSLNLSLTGNTRPCWTVLDGFNVTPCISALGNVFSPVNFRVRGS
jgi:prepilin signal peptidase PulO-like enzyme (type II secretory pathway)